MPINPFKHKHDASRAYKGVKFVEVRCLKDGFTRKFTDDGPHEVDSAGKPIEGWQTKTRQSGASNAIVKLREREPDPLGGPRGDNPEAIVPVFVAVDANNPPRVWDSVSRSYVEAAVMTPHLEKVMAHFIGQRNQIADQAASRAKAVKAESEAKASAGVDALVAAIGDRLAGKVAAKPEAKAKDAPKASAS